MLVLIQMLWPRQIPFMLLLALVITLLLELLMTVQETGLIAEVLTTDVHPTTIDMVVVAVLIVAPVLLMTAGLLTAIVIHRCLHLLPLAEMTGTMIVTTEADIEEIGMTLVTVVHMTTAIIQATIAVFTTEALIIEGLGTMIGVHLVDLILEMVNRPRTLVQVQVDVIQPTAALHNSLQNLMMTNLHLFVIPIPRILLPLLQLLPKSILASSLLLIPKPQKRQQKMTKDRNSLLPFRTVSDPYLANNNSKQFHLEKDVDILLELPHLRMRLPDMNSNDSVWKNVLPHLRIHHRLLLLVLQLLVLRFLWLRVGMLIP